MDADRYLEMLLDSYAINFLLVAILVEIGISGMTKRNFSLRNLISLYSILFALRLLIHKL